MVFCSIKLNDLHVCSYGVIDFSTEHAEMDKCVMF